MWTHRAQYMVPGWDRCECGNEPTNYIKGGQSIDHPSNCQPLRRISFHYRYLRDLTVLIKIPVFWGMTPCRSMYRYHLLVQFDATIFHVIQDSFLTTLKTEAASSSETLEPVYRTSLRGISEDWNIFICLSIHLSIHPSIHPSVRPSVHPSVRLSFYPI